MPIKAVTALPIVVVIVVNRHEQREYVEHEHVNESTLVVRNLVVSLIPNIYDLFNSIHIPIIILYKF